MLKHVSKSYGIFCVVHYNDNQVAGLMYLDETISMCSRLCRMRQSRTVENGFNLFDFGHQK